MDDYDQHMTTRKIGKNMKKIWAIEWIECGQNFWFERISWRIGGVNDIQIWIYEFIRDYNEYIVGIRIGKSMRKVRMMEQNQISDVESWSQECKV